VVGCYKHGNETSNSLKDGEFVGQFRDYSNSRRALIHEVGSFVICSRARRRSEVKVRPERHLIWQ
jgi:hypothetical protein